MCGGHGTQPAGAIWLKGANLQLLRLSFCLAVYLCDFVLSTAINTAAVLKASVFCCSVFWQADLAPAINSPFLKKT